MSLAIKVTDLSKSFSDNKVLKNININVPQNSVYGFLGNNGAGKSTLIRTILGLLKYDTGKIQINGESINYKSISYKKNIGSLVDSPCLYLQLTPKEFLGITCKLKNFSKIEIGKALDIVNMQSHSTKPMNNFSLGMKQRIAIANALIGSPKLLILDEPTNGLDPIGMLEIRELLKDLPNRLNTTVFLSSHLLDEIQKTASDVGILHQGEMKIESSLKSLLKNESSSLDISTDHPKELHQYFLNQNQKTKIVSTHEIRLLNIKKDQCSIINSQIINQGFTLIESRFNQPSLENLFLDIVNAEILDSSTYGEKHVV